MRRAMISALALASCGPGGVATPSGTTQGGTSTNASETTRTSDAPPDASSDDGTTTTGDGADACAAPLPCGADCLQWEWVLQRFGDDTLGDVALAPGGTIYATGQRGAQDGALGDAFLVVLGADGGEILTDVLFEGLGDPDHRFVAGVAVGPDGRVGVLGQLEETPYVLQTMVVELRGAEGELAHQVLDEGCRAGTLAFVGDGGLLVAGVCDGAGTLRKYDAELVLAWEKQDLPAGLFAVELLEPIGDEVIIGGITSERLGLARLGADGIQIWGVENLASELGLFRVNDLAILPTGDVIVVGSRAHIGASRGVARFDAASGLRWSKTLVSASSESSGLVGAVVDASGRIFVTGDDDLFELSGQGDLVGCWEHEAPDGSAFPKARAMAGSAELGLIVAGSGSGDVDRYASVVRVVP